MLDVINSVGLSGSMLKVIERRHKSDAYLALGSMVRAAAGRLCRVCHGGSVTRWHACLLKRGSGLHRQMPTWQLHCCQSTGRGGAADGRSHLVSW
jgi:hypothetical protein